MAGKASDLHTTAGAIGDIHARSQPPPPLPAATAPVTAAAATTIAAVAPAPAFRASIHKTRTDTQRQYTQTLHRHTDAYRHKMHTDTRDRNINKAHTATQELQKQRNAATYVPVRAHTAIYTQYTRELQKDNTTVVLLHRPYEYENSHGDTHSHTRDTPELLVQSLHKINAMLLATRKHGHECSMPDIKHTAEAILLPLGILLLLLIAPKKS